VLRWGEFTCVGVTGNTVWSHVTGDASYLLRCVNIKSSYKQHFPFNLADTECACMLVCLYDYVGFCAYNSKVIIRRFDSPMVFPAAGIFTNSDHISNPNSAPSWEEMWRLCRSIYQGRSINSRTVLFSKHTSVTVKNQNYYEVIWPLLYITYHGFIYDITLWRHYYYDINDRHWFLA